MNFAPPQWVKEAAEEALNSVATNHYSHPKGRLRLREAIKAHYEPDFGRSLNPETEILVTSGANEGTLTVFIAVTPMSPSILTNLTDARPILRLCRILGTGR